MSDVPEKYFEALKYALAKEIADTFPLTWYEKLYGKVILFFRRFTR